MSVETIKRLQSRNPRPFYVYYRNTLNGYKGYRTFKTRNEQVNFITRAPWHFAITAYN